MNYETTVNAEAAAAVDPLELDGAPAKRSRRTWIIAGFILVVLLAAIAFYFYTQRQGAATTPASDRDDQAPVISVVTPGAATIAGEITAVGSLAARRDMPVGVAGEGGRVISVPVDAGDWVNAGQVLAVIDRSVQNQQLSSAAAQVDVAQADANLAQANLDRALKLVDRGFISKADVDRLTATRDSAVARVRVARAQVAELRARNARLNVVAPAAGLVLERNVEPGQVVSGGSGALFRIARGGEMELMAQLSEGDLAAISTGVEAKVVPAGTQKAFTGQVWQISPVINEQNRQGVARISLPYAPELRPGGFATATIKSGTIVAPMLPESAVLSDADGAYVYVVNAENKAVTRRVETGMVTDQGIAITKGLSGNEQVVLRAGGFLTEGETVSPSKQGE